MDKKTQQLQTLWRKRLMEELPQQHRQKCHSILQWLLSHDNELERSQELTSDDLTNISKKLEYRYGILRKRYLEVKPHHAYRSLIGRLGSLMMGFYLSRSWMKDCQQSQKEMMRLIPQIVQELLEHDPYLQRQINRIAQCTQDRNLREALVLASVEEYCLHPVKNQPLLIYHLRQYLRRQLETSSQPGVGSGGFKKANDFPYLMEKLAVFS